MTLKRISEVEINKLTHHWNPIPSRLDGITPETIKIKLFRVVAQAQLEADQKEYDELKEELEYLYESYEVAIEVLDTEHDAVIREIKEGLENWRQPHPNGGWVTVQPISWQEFWQKYGGE